MMDFTGKIVLVTGGSRGIGAATSRAFANQGATLAVNYRADSASAATILDELGSNHRAYQADVASHSDCQRLVNEVLADFGRIDVLVNNAGIHEQHPIESTGYDDWERIFQETLAANLMGPARLMFLCAQHMKRQGYGRIVNISSRGAFRGEPDQPAYGASKAGLNALSQSLAIKLAPDNVFVGVVAPGFVETDLARAILEGPRGDGIRSQSTLKRVAKPEEVAYAALFLASEGSEFTTGTILDVNGASYLRS